jgi:uncharacterized membrane protein
MNKGATIAVLIMVIIILCYIFLKTVQFLMPVLILLGLIMLSVGALVWVVKSTFKKKDDPKV